MDAARFYQKFVQAGKAEVTHHFIPGTGHNSIATRFPTNAAAGHALQFIRELCGTLAPKSLD